MATGERETRAVSLPELLAWIVLGRDWDRFPGKIEILQGQIGPQLYFYPATLVFWGEKKAWIHLKHLTFAPDPEALLDSFFPEADREKVWEEALALVPLLS